MRTSQTKSTENYRLLEIAQYVKEAMEHVRSMQERSGVILLGVTGSGKSLLANHLLEQPLVRWNRKKMGEFEAINGVDEQRNNGEIYLDPSVSAEARKHLPVIGGTIDAQTKYIRPYFARERCILDAPGLRDPNENQRLAHSLAFQKLVQQASKLKIAIVIDCSTIFSRKEAIENLVKELGELFIAARLNNTKEKNTLFLFNHLPEYKDLDDVKLKISEICASLERDIQSPTLSSDQRILNLNAIELCRAIERSKEQCVVVTFLEDQAEKNAQSVQENRDMIFAKLQDMQPIDSSICRFETREKEVFKGNLKNTFIIPYVQLMRDEALHHRVIALAKDNLSCLEKYRALLADPAQWKETIATDFRAQEAIKTKNETDLLTIEQQLDAKKRQLAALNPDADVEYCVLQPSEIKHAGRAILTTTAVIAGIIATSATGGLAGAIIAMVGIFGYGFNEMRPTSVTYHSPIQLTRTETRRINAVNSAFLNQDYIIHNVETSADKMTCTAKFIPTHREVSSDGVSSDVWENEVLVIYVKKENHPDFSLQIAQLRSAINKIDQLKKQCIQSIEAANQLMQVLHSLQEKKMTTPEFARFLDAMKEKEKSKEALTEIQTLLLEHKDEFAAVDFMLTHLEVPVYGLDFKNEYEGLIQRFSKIRDEATFPHQTIASSVLPRLQSAQSETAGARFIGRVPSYAANAGSEMTLPRDRKAQAFTK